MRKIFTLCFSIALAMFTVDANADVRDCGMESEYSYSYEKASLCIYNKSEYTLTVKIMRNNGGGLYSTISIPAKSSRTVYFSNSGSFYTKLKAEKGIIYEGLFHYLEKIHWMHPYTMIWWCDAE